MYIKSLLLILFAFLIPNLISCTSNRDIEYKINITKYVPSSKFYIPDLNNIREMAYAGDMNAQYEYSKLFFDGIGVKKNTREGFIWLKKSAENGNPEAQYKLGMYYYNGVGVNASFEEGCRWLEASASLGHHLAQEEFINRCMD